ncbi:winged helix-turn-helix domain-containing protein [Mycobacterium sp. AZCC_0083]|uniref:winged helix-turn-helix domain-containing protein n=1 Tax=Mycobacterium sp. AZCC_0083 TaxID=2735882 RepID=UPI001609FB54|nr:winged helix-turn-helix domain-containing protein [Mycobacterium sp. AZCC_0083]MBB5160991.1 DNA-binding response OmpR family regulator [Mycobacterium sp. AZCC_0083]
MYQAAPRPAPAEELLRVVLVIDLPANAADLAVRTAELADEYARVIAMSIPGVRPHSAVVEGRRAPAVPSREGLLIDHVRRHVLIDGVPVRLAYREFELLRYLARRPGSVVSRDELVREVWHDAPRAATGVSVRTVDTHVRRLRVKLGRYQGVLTSVRGHGYRFEPRPDVRVVGPVTRPA